MAPRAPSALTFRWGHTVADLVYENYRCEQGDTVDLIAFKRFGSSSGTTESILDANPGLATAGPILPLGMMIRIP